MGIGKLLDRVPPDDYKKEWAQLLDKEKGLTEANVEASMIIFKLGKEWLALATSALAEVCEPRAIHHLPHRTGKILKGVVNIRGRLCICVSMHDFLEIYQKSDEDLAIDASKKRMIVARHGEEIWVFTVDEVLGIQNFEQNKLKNVPITVTKSTANFLRGMLEWETKNVGFLDEELLFQSLRRGIS